MSPPVTPATNHSSNKMGSWRSWLARRSHIRYEPYHRWAHPKVVSSSLTDPSCFLFFLSFSSFFPFFLFVLFFFFLFFSSILLLITFLPSFLYSIFLCILQSAFTFSGSDVTEFYYQHKTSYISLTFPKLCFSRSTDTLLTLGIKDSIIKGRGIKQSYRRRQTSTASKVLSSLSKVLFLFSFLFPLSSFLFPLSSFLFPLSSFLFPLSSFLFPFPFVGPCRPLPRPPVILERSDDLGFSCQIRLTFDLSSSRKVSLLSLLPDALPS